MPFNLGLGEVLVVLVIALIVFGGRLPQVGRSLGQGLREFTKGIRGVSSPVEDDDPDELETGEAASTPEEPKEQILEDLEGGEEQVPQSPDEPEGEAAGDPEEEEEAGGNQEEGEEKGPSEPTPGDRSP